MIMSPEISRSMIHNMYSCDSSPIVTNGAIVSWLSDFYSIIFKKIVNKSDMPYVFIAKIDLAIEIKYPSK